MPGPVLRSLTIADTSQSWADAGFAVATSPAGQGIANIGGIEVRLAGNSTPGVDRRGITGWAFLGIDDGSIDGLPTLAAAEVGTLNQPEQSNPNGAVHLDHVVMASPDLERTMEALRMNGFEPRRTREIPNSEPPQRQVFFWAGETIIELVGHVEPTGHGPASLWGLAITTDDLDRTALELGHLLGDVKPAVQAGRHIATLRTKELDISTPIAFMTPHESSLV